MVEAGLLARVVRGEKVESVHYGHLVTTGIDGEIIGSIGDPNAQIYPRSSIKPIQLQAMCDAGLELDDEHLAIACASHSGEDIHRKLATEILHKHGLDVDDLRNTPDYPISLAEQRKGQGETRLNQNCSGKHAAMLATCVINGWDTDTYYRHDHPLQQLIRSTIGEWTGGEVGDDSVDGCGAPLFSVSLVGLARAFARLVREGSPIARAMNAYPRVVAGSDRDATFAMRAIPTLIAKDGAEGVYAAAFEGGAVAFKIGDGSGRPRPAILANALASLGVADDKLAWGVVPTLGHGEKIGQVEACAPSSHA